MAAAPEATAHVMRMSYSTIQAFIAMPTAHMSAAQAIALPRVLTISSILHPSSLAMVDIILEDFLVDH